jgi:CBS domain-containing protein
MKVKMRMEADPAACAIDRNMDEAARIMRERGTLAVYVVDGGHLAGVVRDRDVALAVHGWLVPLHRLAVRDSMGPALCSVQSDDSLEAAEALMRRHGLRELPVVDPRGALVGSLEARDVVSAPRAGAAAAPLHAVPPIVAYARQQALDLAALTEAEATRDLFELLHR